jgi:threonylcarbamoyladenosine tRNA methylthiotransferase MtaB
MKDAGFCDSFHVSMQSGCDETLRKMNSHYTCQEFLSKIELIRKYFPDAGITTDLIVGFPEETDENFAETVDTVKKAGFLDMHVFPYSIRPGTKAAKMKQVNAADVTKRLEIMKDVTMQATKNFLESQIGKINKVFVEESCGEYNVGHSSNFIKVYTTAPIGSFYNHVIKSEYKDGAIGEIV